MKKCVLALALALATILLMLVPASAATIYTMVVDSTTYSFDSAPGSVRFGAEREVQYPNMEADRAKKISLVPSAFQLKSGDTVISNELYSLELLEDLVLVCKDRPGQPNLGTVVYKANQVVWRKDAATTSDPWNCGKPDVTPEPWYTSTVAAETVAYLGDVTTYTESTSVRCCFSFKDSAGKIISLDGTLTVTGGCSYDDCHMLVGAASMEVTLVHTVTLDSQSATTAGTENVKVSNGSAMPAITVPVKDGLIFVGYYSEPGGAGKQYYNADGTSAASWDKDADGTLYAYYAAASVSNSDKATTYYTTVQAAINAAASGDTVKMLVDSAERVTIASDDNLTLDLNGKVLNGSGSGSVIINNGTLTICDSSSTAVHNFEVGSTGLWTLTTKTKTVDYDSLSARPAEDAVVAVSGGCITGGNASYGGGIYSTGSLTITGGNIIGNSSTSEDSTKASGAGVFFNGTTLAMTGGRIIGNAAPLGTSKDYGGGGAGGVSVVKGTFNLSGGTVSFNTARFGGGIRLGCGSSTTDAALNLSGTASVNFNMGNGNGSAVQMHGSDPQFTMTGGTITGNTYTGAGSGGAYDTGILVFTGDFIMTGGTITANYDTNTTPAPAVNVMNTGSITLGGNAQISGNSTNLYLSSGKTVTISSDTAPTELMSIGVTTQTVPGVNNPVAVTAATDIDYSERFTSDNASYTVFNDGSGTNLIVKLGLPIAYINDGTDTVYYTDLQNAIDAAAKGETEAAQTVVLIKNGIAYTQQSSCTFSVPADKTVILDLNGNTISYRKAGSYTSALFYVGKNADFTVKNGTISGTIDIGSDNTGNDFDAFRVDAPCKLNIQCDIVKVAHIVTNCSEAANTETPTVTIGDGTDQAIYFAAANNCWSINRANQAHKLAVNVTSPLKFLWSYAGGVWDAEPAHFSLTAAGTVFRIEPNNATYDEGLSLKYTADKQTAYPEGSSTVYDTPFEVVLLTKDLTSGIYRLSAEKLSEYVAAGYITKKVSTPENAIAGGTWYEITPFQQSEYSVRVNNAKGAVTDGTWSYFATLQEAIDAADQGNTIEMTADLAENAIVPSGKDVILDLKGSILTALNGTQPILTNNGTLTLIDSEGGGNITGGSMGVEQNGSMTVGGKLQISGNTDGNLYLLTGKTVDVSTQYLPDGMKIGITTKTQPTEDAPVSITGANSVDCSSFFTSDEGYFPENGAGNAVQLIAVRNITLTSSTAEKLYDGTPLSEKTVKITSGSFDEGDTFTFTCTGSMTEVGCAANSFTYELNDSAKQKHYNITCEYGLLTVKAASSADFLPDTTALQKIAAELSKENPGETVSVYMEITQEVSNSDKKAFKACINDNSQTSYYDAKLYAEIDGVKTDIGSDNDTLITVTSSFNFGKRQNIHIYRSHDGKVNELTTSPNSEGEYVTYDTKNNQIIVTAKKYSVFCTVWEESKEQEPETGDNSHICLYAALALVSILGMCVLYHGRKRTV